MSSADLLEYQNEIAVIGMAGQFPGARNVHEFWRNLCNGVESIIKFSDEELLASGVDPALLNHPDYVRAGAVLEDIERFDAPFFNYTPREAEIMDPQQRLFLECAWQALEDAGYATDEQNGRVGVYAGTGMNTYLYSNLSTNPQLMAELSPMQVLLGNEKDHVATRVSYKLNLRGPSVSISTSCSTSLVALHFACQGLLNGECDMALAGGVSVRVPHRTGYLYQAGGIASPDGHCRAFDASAQGTISGNGVGIVVLKRLAEALEDGDSIYAVVKGSAINNDGAGKIGYTAPGIQGQVEVIAEAQALAGVDPESISYVETHGTGTSLGDPIEVAALTEVFRAKTDKKQFCALGSIKTNLGHLDIAAGITGFIKTVLALKYKKLPPSLHFVQPNPNIDFVQSPFYVNTQLTDWENTGSVRRAGVSAFGLGGTNAHVILEEAPVSSVVPSSSPYKLLVFAARTPSSLQKMVTAFAEYSKERPDINLADAAYTLQVGRRHFAQRAFLVAQDQQDITKQVVENSVFLSQEPAEEHPVVFLLSGVAVQNVQIAQELYQHEALFREHVDRCAEIVRPSLGHDLRTLFYQGEGSAATALLNQMDIVQPMLFTVEYALAQVWMAWGVHPMAMIGHSMGEYVAACLAGVFSLEDALSLVILRSRLMQEQPEGAMLNVSLSYEDTQKLLFPGISLAAWNGETDCVVSGLPEAVARLEQQLRQQGIVCHRLSLQRAAHSLMMDPALERFRNEVQRKRLSAPRIPFISNVTGTWITAEEATDPNYWVKHLRSTVRFAEGLRALNEGQGKIFLELGPGRTLTGLAHKQFGHQGKHLLLNSLPNPREPESPLAFLLKTCGRLWCAGGTIHWQRFSAGEPRRRISLPCYPFERQRYWIDPGQGPTIPHMGKNADLASWYTVPSWKRMPLPPLIEQSKEAKNTSFWLIFQDDLDIGRSLVCCLEQTGLPVVVVVAGEQFRQLDVHTYTLSVREPEDYSLLLQEIGLSDITSLYVVHLWNVLALDGEAVDSDMIQARGFYSIMLLLQALDKQNITQEVQLIAVSNNLHDVTGEEMFYPTRATLLGFNQVVPHEYPNVSYRCVDIVVPQHGHAREELALQLMQESLISRTDTIVAYRGRYRWLQTLEAVRLESVEGVPALLRQGGVYLITGGLGGIGLSLANYLARTLGARLVLAGRSALPPDEAWADWLAAHDEDDPISSQIRKVQELRALGSEVLIVAADITKRSAVQALYDQIQERFGTIHGIIHAAGLPGGGMLQLQQLDKVATVLAPKVQGTLFLQEVFNEKPLDFILLCSSLSSILGGMGLADYCASNAFLDNFAFYNTARTGIPTFAINWDTWRNVGMTREVTRVQKLSKIAGIEDIDLYGSIQPEEGAEVFRRILHWSPSPQTIISTRDVHALQERYRRQSTLLDRNSAMPEDTVSMQALDVVSFDEVEQQMARIWQKVLGLDAMGVRDNFFELGGDSVMIIQIIRLIHETFQVSLPMHLMFEKATIADLAEAVKQQQEMSRHEQIADLIERVSQMSEEEALLLLEADLQQ